VPYVGKEKKAGACSDGGGLTKGRFEYALTFRDEYNIVIVEDATLVPGEGMGQRVLLVMRVNLVGICTGIPYCSYIETPGFLFCGYGEVFMKVVHRFDQLG
jgi:hypothetical protein